MHAFALLSIHVMCVSCRACTQENKVVLEARPVYELLRLPPSHQFKSPDASPKVSLHCMHFVCGFGLSVVFFLKVGDLPPARKPSMR